MSRKQIRHLALLTLILWSVSSQCCLGQITIFNVPAADMTPKGQIWQENEGQFRPFPPDEFYLGTHYSALGLGHNLELDITNLNIGAPFTKNLSLGVGGRTIIPILPKRLPKNELKFMAGELIPISLAGTGVGSGTYVDGSGRGAWKKTRYTG